MYTILNRIILTGTILFYTALSFAAKNEDTLPSSQPKSHTQTNTPQKIERKPIGLNFDLGWSSAFVFRGLNVFASNDQLDQHMLLSPSITWTIGQTGLCLSYWGGIQLSGDNISDNIDGGLGLEQDFALKYHRDLSKGFSFTAGFTYYSFFFADKENAGSTAPSYIEPSFTLHYQYYFSYCLMVSDFFGVQDQPSIRDISYFYIAPMISKGYSLVDCLTLDMSLGYGFKIFHEGNSNMDNTHDILLNTSLTYHFSAHYYLKPSVNLAWTNIKNKDFTDGLAFWGGLNIGIDI